MQNFDSLKVPLYGTCLVEASAGTGKTYAISTLFVRMLLESERSVDQILVVTFTEAATAELRDRIRRRLKETLELCQLLEKGKTDAKIDEVLLELLKRQPVLSLARQRLEAALFRFDVAAIFTIHGFCQRVLRDNAFLARIPFEAELVTDVRPLVQEITRDYWVQQFSVASFWQIQSFQGFSPGLREFESFSNTVAGSTEIELLPEVVGGFPRLDDAELRDAFEAAKGQFQWAELDATLRPVYTRDDHREGRLRDVRDFLARPFGSEPVPDKLTWFTPEKVAQSAKKGPVAAHPFFEAAGRLQAQWQQFESVLSDAKVRVKRSLVGYLHSEVRERKTRRRQLSFDDLLTQLASALSGPLGAQLIRQLRTRYKAALIDEFQDTDPVQYGIFSRVFAGDPGQTSERSLFLIGDPKQAIYSFRGADVFAYMQAAERVAEPRRFTMATNYRSDQRLVRAVNALFLRHPRPFIFSELGYPKVEANHTGASALVLPLTLSQAPLEFCFFPQRDGKAPSAGTVKRCLPPRVANHVVQLLSGGALLGTQRLSPKNIAILTRTNQEAFDCQRALAACGVPSVVQGDRSVFEQPEAHELQLVLAAVVDPARASALRTALATDLLGLNAQQIESLSGEETEWDRWVERFQRYHEVWHQQGFVQMFRGLMLECGVVHRLLALSNGERRMTNVLHLVELLHSQTQVEHLGPTGLLQYLSEQRKRETPPGDSEQVRLESDDDAVVLTTIHKSKGLEYPVVLCPYLMGAAAWGLSDHWVLFHDPKTRDQVLDVGSPELEAHQKLKQDEDLSEALRLVYVGLTRAKHKCIVFWGALGDSVRKSAFAELLYGVAGGRAQESLKQVSDDVLLQPLQELAQQVDGVALSLEAPLDPEVPEPVLRWERPNPSSQGLKAQKVASRVAEWSRVASFTELTRDISPAGGSARPASDHDEWAESNEAAAGTSLAENSCILADFPAGANVGNFFHSVLEVSDFQVPVAESLVSEKLRGHGLSVSLGGVAQAALESVLRTPLGPGMSLSMVGSKQRLNELEFTVPVAAKGGLLNSRELARALETSATLETPKHYAQSVAALPFSALKGYLKGFIDLVFEHDGRWYLVDYKTNRLGPRFVDYTPERLAISMWAHHYTLQYHLYSLALDRYLSMRVKGYQYERDFGGVLYLFLRGMSPELGSKTGVFFEKPPQERMQALSLALAGKPSNRSVTDRSQRQTQRERA